MTAATFTYTDGKIACSNGWSYDFQLVFRCLLIVHPKYLKMPEFHGDPKIPEGAFSLSRMVMALADDDWIEKFGIDGPYSDFGQWLKLNRRTLWNDSAEWFDLPPVSITPVPVAPVLEPVKKKDEKFWGKVKRAIE